MTKSFVVFRTDRGAPMVYGGPYPDFESANENRVRLEKNGSCVNPQELRARKFEVKLVEQGEEFLWWDSIRRRI